MGKASEEKIMELLQQSLIDNQKILAMIDAVSQEIPPEGKTQLDLLIEYFERTNVK